MTKFVKSHGLGNSYIILDQEQMDFKLKRDNIIKICDIDFGIGSDGILLKVPTQKADFGVRIFNPDGSEAEISGNGIRIFGKYLFDYGLTSQKKMTIDTLGGISTIEILSTEKDKATVLRAGMGKANFYAPDIPVDLELDEVLNYALKIGQESLAINCVSLGNPHCVIFTENLDEDKIRTLGPILENHSLFPARINVQFARIITANEIDILIWERGAGYTQASGTSSCAVAAVAKKRFDLDPQITIHMPGGSLKIDISDDWDLLLTGPVEQVCEGILMDSLKK